MRRKIALILSMLMITLAFTGCSQAELGYLQMNRDIMNGLSKSTAIGSVDFEVDAEDLREFVHNVAKEAGADEATLITISDYMRVYFGLEGKTTATLDYKISCDSVALGTEVELQLKYNDKSYDLGKSYFDMEEGYFISTKAVVGLYSVVKDIFGEKRVALSADPEYEKALIAEFLKADHIVIPTQGMDGLSPKEVKNLYGEMRYKTLYNAVLNMVTSMQDTVDLSPKEVKSLYSNMKYKAVYNAALNMYENAFDGFSTNMVTETNGGYEVNVNGQQIAAMLVELLGYAAENVDSVTKAYFDFRVAVTETVDKEWFEKEDRFRDLDLLYKTYMPEDLAQALKEDILWVQQGLQMALGQTGVCTALEAMSYETSIIKNGKDYVAKETFVIDYKGRTAIRLISSVTTSPTTKSVVLPTASATLAQVEEALRPIESRYNPVNGAKITWGWGDANGAAIFDLRAEPALYRRGYTETTYQMVDNRIYLPLRTICDVLYETVIWDQASKTASVGTGIGAVEMEGIIVDGRTFIKARDFEKLGYTVEFTVSIDRKHVYLSKE